MGFIRHILRLCVIMLLSVAGANMAIAVPLVTSDISYFQTETTHFSQTDVAGFAARAPPLAAANVAFTGDATVMHGGAVCMSYDIASLDGSSKKGSINATNRGFHSSGYRSDFYDTSGNPTKWMNPLTGKLEDIPAGTKFHKDHVFPQAEIKNLPGFNELTPAQRTSLLNDPKNFQPLNGSMNCSKSCRVEGTPNDWPTYKGEPLNPQYRDWLRTQQQSMDQNFRSKIDEMLGG